MSCLQKKTGNSWGNKDNTSITKDTTASFYCRSSWHDRNFTHTCTKTQDFENQKLSDWPSAPPHSGKTLLRMPQFTPSESVWEAFTSLSCGPSVLSFCAVFHLLSPFRFNFLAMTEIHNFCRSVSCLHQQDNRLHLRFLCTSIKPGM